MSGRRHATLIMVLVLIGTAVWLLASAPPSAAHTHVEVGPSEFVVGWLEEPPIVGLLNGVFLGLSWVVNGTPVVGVQDRLTVTLLTGPASMVGSLEPLFSEPGGDTCPVIPTWGRFVLGPGRGLSQGHDPQLSARNRGCPGPVCLRIPGR